MKFCCQKSDDLVKVLPIIYYPRIEDLIIMLIGLILMDTKTSW